MPRRIITQARYFGFGPIFKHSNKVHITIFAVKTIFSIVYVTIYGKNKKQNSFFITLLPFSSRDVTVQI